MSKVKTKVKTEEKVKTVHMSTIEKLKEISNGTNRNPDLSFVKEDFNKSPLISKKKILKCVSTYCVYKTVGPAMCEVYAELAPIMKNNAFFETGRCLEADCLNIIVSISDDPRWTLLHSINQMHRRIQNDAHSRLDYGRSCCYIITAYAEYEKYPCLRRRLLTYVGQGIGGRIDNMLLGVIDELDPTMSDEMFELVKPSVRRIQFAWRGKPPPVKSKRLNQLIGEAMVCQQDIDNALTSAIEHGIDPLKVPNANKTLVKAAEFFKELYSTNN